MNGDVADVIHESQGLIEWALGTLGLTKVEAVLLLVILGLLFALARRRNGQ